MGTRFVRLSTARAAAIAIVLGGAVFVVTAAAQGIGAPAAVLHEDIAAPEDEAARTAQRVKSSQPIFGPEPVEGQNPSAIGVGEKILPEPPEPAAANSGEPIHGSGDFAADRATDFRPDRQTGADGTLHYAGVFNPSVVPFKRMSAMDAVRDNYALYSAETSLVDLVVGGKPEASDKLFWGSIVVRLTTGEDVPIPSVSADMRILSYEATPRVGLVFSKDGADNYFVRTDEPGLAGSERRLVFLAAADTRYFTPVIPLRLRVADIDGQPVRALPASIRAVADRGLRKLGLHRRMPLEQALQGLVFYFRSFEAKDPPPSTGDIYWDLFASQAGVCRHRSFAFMVTANALGIPTRFVANEAHAWVEVWLPGSGWARIDLGGAALRLEVDNATNKTLFRAGPDPFVQPPAYSENYSTLDGDVSGLSDRQLDEAHAPADTEGDSPGGFGKTGDGNGDDGDGAGEAPGGTNEPPQIGDDGVLTAPGPGLPEIPAEQLAGKQPTMITVTGASATGFRGETITVTGTLKDPAGRGLGRHRIDIYLAPKGLDGDDNILLGNTVSTESGTWTAVISVPANLALIEYELYAATPGSAKYQPSLSE